MEIIPAIYVLNGKCVALYKASFEQKETYFKSPLQMALFFEKEGAKKIHLVDLNGRKEGKFSQRDLVHRLTLAVKIPIQLEAGFPDLETIQASFQLGVSKVVLRPAALNIIQSAIQKFGAEKIMVELQAKGSDIVSNGSTKTNHDHTAEPEDVVDFAEKLVPLGVKNIIYKDERSEGTMVHPNYDEVDRLFLITGQQLKIYVSGGISEIKHLKLLQKIGASGAIIGKAFYERTITLKEAVQAVEN